MYLAPIQVQNIEEPAARRHTPDTAARCNQVTLQHLQSTHPHAETRDRYIQSGPPPLARRGRPQPCRGAVRRHAPGAGARHRQAGTPATPGRRARLEHGWWYQYYFATERGKAGYEANTRAFAKPLWKTNSPKWDFDDATFERSAASFDNPDYSRIVIHNYRWRLGLVEGEQQYDALERRLAGGPPIKAPSITLDGDADGVAPASDGTAYTATFTGPRRHRIVKGAGHNLPQEAPVTFARAVIDAVSL